MQFKTTKRRVPCAHAMSFIAICALFLASNTTAQSISIPVGVAGTTGCQGPGNPPPLTGGALGMGILHYSYDASLARLTLVLQNITPVVPGQMTALVTDAYFNLPAGITGATLLTQTQGAGTVVPQYTLLLGSISVNCFGTFSAQLDNGTGSAGGISNAAATSISGPPGSAVTGPATFVLALSGPATGTLSTLNFVQAMSSGGAYSVATAMKFQGGGVGGDQSGVQGSSTTPICPFPASVELLPQPCGGALAPLVSASNPVLGQALTLTVTSQLPWAYGYTFLSIGAPPTLTGQGCNVDVDLLNGPNFILIDNFVTYIFGGHSQVVLLPNTPVLYGFVFTVQVRLCSPLGPVGPLSRLCRASGLCALPARQG